MDSLLRKSLQDFRRSYPIHVTFGLLNMFVTSFIFVPLVTFLYHRIIRMYGSPSLINRDVMKIALSYQGIIALFAVGFIFVLLLFFQFGVMIFIAHRSMNNEAVTIIESIWKSLRKLPQFFTLGILPFMFLLVFVMPWIDSPLSVLLQDHVNLPIVITTMVENKQVMLWLYVVVMLAIGYALLRLIFTLHFMIIYDLPLKNAMLASIAFTKAHKLRIVITLTFVHILFMAATFLVAAILSSVPENFSHVALRFFVESYFVPFFSIVSFVLTLLLIPLHITILTRMFHTYQAFESYQAVFHPFTSGEFRSRNEVARTAVYVRNVETAQYDQIAENDLKLGDKQADRVVQDVKIGRKTWSNIIIKPIKSLQIAKTGYVLRSRKTLRKHFLCVRKHFSVYKEKRSVSGLIKKLFPYARKPISFDKENHSLSARRDDTNEKSLKSMQNMPDPELPIMRSVKVEQNSHRSWFKHVFTQLVRTLSQTERTVFQFFRKRKRLLLITAFLYLTGMFFVTYVINDHLVYLKWNVKVIAHRGDWTAPENSLQAVRSALEKGVDLVEVDVQMTRDGVLVLHHDDNLQRVAGITARVGELTMEQIAQLEIGLPFPEISEGARIPMLEQVLQEVNGEVPLLIELKADVFGRDMITPLIELIERYEMEQQVWIQSFDYSLLQQIRNINPTIRIGQVLYFAVGDITALDVDFYTIRQSMLSERMIQRAHKAEREVYVWTVNIEKNIREVLKYDVDGIITDYPEKVQKLIGIETD